jgi:hypothetical protein
MLVCFIGWLWIGACLRELSSSKKLSKLGRLAMPSQQLSWVAFMELWIQSLLLFYVEWLTICQVPVLFATWNWSLFLFGVYFHLGLFCSFYLLSCDLPFPFVLVLFVLVLLCSSLSWSYLQFIPSFVCLSTCLNVVFSVWLRRELRFFQRGSHVILAIGLAHRTRSHSWLLDTASRRLARARPLIAAARESVDTISSSTIDRLLDDRLLCLCSLYLILHPSP